MLLRITASAFNDRGPLYMEQTLAALHEAMRGKDVATLILRRDAMTVGMACDVPPTLRQIVSTQLLSQYPSAKIEHEESQERVLPVWTVELSLNADVFPL